MTGIVALGTAVGLQIAYTTLCVVRRAFLLGLRAVINCAGLMALSLLLLFGVFEWSARWAMLFVVLLWMSIFSVVRLLTKRQERPFRTSKAIRQAVGGALLLCIAVLPAILFPQYRHPAVTGPYRVATTQETYTDASRAEIYSDEGKKREVNVAFWYPEDAQGQYPLVVFSHGFCGINYSNESAYMELASHGYVVGSIDHPYHSFYTVNDDKTMTLVDAGYMNEYASLGDDPAANLRYFQKWMDIRVSDISFVIDTILSKQDGLYGLVNREKIGVFGHSLGAAAAMGMPRVRTDIDAVINLDGPMMCEYTGEKNGEYTVNTAPYPAPLLHIYSQYLYDNGIEKNDREYFVNRLVSATAPASFEVVFRGAQHLSLTDLSLVSPPLALMLDSGRTAQIDPLYCLETMNAIILRFFDSYLKDVGEFKSAGFY